MAGTGRRLLDDHPLRHRRPPRQALPHRHQRHQRSHDRRKRQGLADYVREVVGKKPLACAIAYDTRHRSREFAELCARIMAAAGFKVWFLDGYRSTPEASFAVRYKNCDCGIMITASHNPPTDNALKVYWSTGGQLLPPHDNNVIDRVYRVKEIMRIPWEEGLASGRIEYCQEEVDAAFVAAVMRQSTAGPRDLKIIYSPLHGVGASAVCPVLDAAGFKDVEVFGPHAAPDPDFTNVPGHVANPENAVVFDAMIARGQADRRGLDPGHRPRLRSAGLCRPADSCRRRCLGNPYRQPDRLAADRFVACRPEGGGHASSRSCMSSKRWSPRS